MANHAERKETYNPTPIGNLVPLTMELGWKPIRHFDDIQYPPPPPQGDPRPPHIPPLPGGRHTATYSWTSIGKLHQKSLASLAFEIESRRKKELHLRIWISEGEGKKNLWKGKFVSREFKLHVDGKSTIRLDHAAQQRAQPFFVKGNTLALIAYPPQEERHFKVRVGMLAGSAARSKKARR